jgi:tetratricopeptide (TPR) repeat protein
MMMRNAALLLLLAAPLGAQEALDRKFLLESVEQISSQYRLLKEEIDHLKTLLGAGPELEDLQPLAGTKAMSERVRTRLVEGGESFQSGDYEDAKKKFQIAWEKAPDKAVTNYNLGITYHRLGNFPLAKKMLKAALEQNETIAGSSKIRSYLLGGEDSPHGKELSEEDKVMQTAMTNLKKEASSYLHMKSLPLPKRRAETVKVLRQMRAKAEDNSNLKQDYFLEVADSYALFELYDDAVAVLDEYEQSMRDKVLPDGFYSKRLQIEGKKAKLSDSLEGYIGNQPDPVVAREIKNDKEELEIFASQLSQFAQELDDEDPDFTKISKRLNEYRWGGKPNRHVLVVSRFEELLHSSLKGTLPIDRYQDIQGNKFLKDITRLADRMVYKQVETKKVELSVGNHTVPYYLLYTYIPKHEAFIIVRIPRADLG